MPPPTDLGQKIRDILSHTAPLPPEAAAPLRHYSRAGMDLANLLHYLDRNLGRLSLQAAALSRHMARLHGMLMVNLIETFERYLKEVATVCVDSLARYVLDDRFNAFKVQGSALAAHFGTDTLGRSLCESATWLDCDEVKPTVGAEPRPEPFGVRGFSTALAVFVVRGAAKQNNQSGAEAPHSKTLRSECGSCLPG